MEKSFVDHWLLGDYDQILHYQTIGNFDKLNTLEQCLLTFAVLQSDKEAAQTLASRIKLASDSYTKHVPVEVKNRMFDTVLSLNNLQKDTAKLNLLKEVEITRVAKRPEAKQVEINE
mmetsp:Transcript_40223/g.46145  ORF Transcript_40223/g.46145 Transcript_40223/m.46145 type:complete len:117 (-) Transcript_40223:34-384(-)